MLFPETIYEKDLPAADTGDRKLVISIAPERCDAAVWSNGIPGSLRIVSTTKITLDQTGQWTGFEDFLYDNPGLLAPMSQTTVMIATDDIVMVPKAINRDNASRLLYKTALSCDIPVTSRYIETWHECCDISVGLLLPSKLHRFITRSFQPVNIRWYASAIAEYWKHMLTTVQSNATKRLQAIAVVSAALRLTLVVLDSNGNMVAAISRKGTSHSDLSYHILSLLASLTASISDDVNLYVFGVSQEITAIKQELSGWIDARLYTYISGKSSIIDPAQLHLIAPELITAIETV
ncbi:MAG: hypothetical protein K2L69_07820 [Muribaculaceae bacterium]|nr:hypothetical protein [Muribaculaceae bacterium]MDE6610451.1 hypothetical protein [Muribaculaceae bacterium]